MLILSKILKFDLNNKWSRSGQILNRAGGCALPDFFGRSSLYTLILYILGSKI